LEEKTMKKLFASFVVAGLFGVSALQAESVQAHFHLAFAAYFGSSSLAPGDYRISLLEEQSGLKRVVIEGQNGRVQGFPMALQKDVPPGPSSLELVKSDGNYFIREYRSQYTGRVYTFAMPKNVHPVQTEIVQITK
jgi:hypothetical protein